MTRISHVHKALAFVVLLIALMCGPARATRLAGAPPGNPIQSALDIHFDVDGSPLMISSEGLLRPLGGQGAGTGLSLPRRLAEIMGARAAGAFRPGFADDDGGPATLDPGREHPIVLSLDDIDVRAPGRPRLVIVEGAGGPVAAVTRADLRSIAYIQDGANVAAIGDIDPVEEARPAPSAFEIPDWVLYALVVASLVMCAVLAGRIVLRRRIRRPDYAALPSRLMNGRRR